MTDQEKPDSDTPDDDNPAEALPPGVPEPPDMSKVRDLRQQMDQDRADRRGSRRGRNTPTGKQGRDIGTYTIIPMMMLAGPLVGYLLGKGLENIFGGEPWPGVAGMLFGMVAAFRQIFLLLADRAKRDQGE